MKRFVWRLQRVLDIKIKVEQAKKAELAELTEKLTKTQSEVLTQKMILTNLINDLKNQEPSKRLAKQELFLKYMSTNDAMIKKLQVSAKKLESAQKQKIAEVLDIKRFRESLEKLRAEAKTQFIKEQEKLEQKDMDERATLSFARKKSVVF